MIGVVKFYQVQKGFGFIKVDGGKDVFFHKSGVVRGYEPAENDQVEFDVTITDRGNAAEDVRKI